ncbi:XdhC/CoxI family protein [Desulfosporosinus sp.]|uniref:XdhC family protein n=1 Tax=Desulfosporosinus sp. TaxID=157907 RepID=UPI002636045A|nr:XdhC/CoxI family protein [Desulfosporosinus sp.]
MDKEVIKALRVVLEEGLEATLITVVKVLGSVPRKPGAQMLVFADGTTAGTIGGGCGEADAKREALQVMTTHQAKKYSLNMTADIAEDEGMVCGGIMELFIDYLGPQCDSEQIALLENYFVSLDHGESPLLVTVTESNEDNLGKKMMIIQKDGQFSGDLGSPALNRAVLENREDSSGKASFAILNLDDSLHRCGNNEAKPTVQLMLEPPVCKAQLLILGGGHIALPLAGMAEILGFEVSVVDDRPSFANPGRFRTANRVICNDFERALDELEIGTQTHVVIVTRGHRHDKVCLKKVIHRPAGYIGMIGSRRRVKSLFAELQGEGIPEERLQQVYSPIGLKIGAETPEEIALCILGEIINVHKNPDKKIIRMA